jgi:hypothetical protein
MTRDEGDDARWVEGTLEAGADPNAAAEQGGGRVPNPQTGVGLGAGKGSSFEPEEDSAAEERQE